MSYLRLAFVQERDFNPGLLLDEPFLACDDLAAVRRNMVESNSTSTRRFPTETRTTARSGAGIRNSVPWSPFKGPATILT